MHNGLDHPEIDMLNEQNETTEQESNLFTVMDEHIPSPPEIEAEDVLVLPEIQSMTDYIRLHLEEKLVEELSRRLRCGELLVPSGGRLYQELPWAGSEDDEEESVSDPGSPEPKDCFPVDWEDPRFSAPEKRGHRMVQLPPRRGMRRGGRPDAGNGNRASVVYAQKNGVPALRRGYVVRYGRGYRRRLR